MARCASLLGFLLTLVGIFSVGFPALANETVGPDSPVELTRLELFVQTAASTETNQVLRLRGADARQQLLVTAHFSTGALRDYTREVSYQTSPAGVIQVSKTGRVTPLAEGTATITAKIRVNHPAIGHPPPHRGRGKGEGATGDREVHGETQAQKNDAHRGLEPVARLGAPASLPASFLDPHPGDVPAGMPALPVPVHG